LIAGKSAIRAVTQDRHAGDEITIALALGRRTLSPY
jgi:hypothetical protein